MKIDKPNAIAATAALVVLGGLLLPATARAGDEPEKKIVKKVVVKNCEGEDCEETHKVHRRIFVSDDGEVHEVGGHGHHWVAAHHGKGGFLGIYLTELTPELREHFGTPATSGVMVSKVQEDTPASRAGLRVGDIVTAVDGKPMTTARQLAAAIQGHGEGESVQLEVYRDRQPLTVTAQVEVRESPMREGRMMMLDCDGDEDCDFDFDFEFDEGITRLSGLDCGGDGPCRIEVECKGETCECTANGEPLDCARIPGVPGHGG